MAADAPHAPPGPLAPTLLTPETHAAAARLSCRVRGRAGSLLHSGVTVRGFYAVHALGASVPLAAGVALFGWRAAAAVGLVVAAAAVALLAWRSVGARGAQLSVPQALWAAALLGIMLPPHLASNAPTPSLTQVFAAPPWPLLAAGGFAVVVLLWLIGGAGAGRFHPALYAYLLLAALFGTMLTPHWVLACKEVGRGDLLKAPTPGLLAPSPEAWLGRPPDPGLDAFWVVPAAHWLGAYTRGAAAVERGRLPLHELLRDRVPPLEDLVIGGHPAPTGQASLVAVIVGGLFLLYRGVIDYRVPLLVVLALYAALLVLPVPTVITDRGPHYRWLIPREPDVGWAAALTFVHYQVAAGPAVFVAFFLATAPSLRPLARRARAVYAILVGLLTAAAQLYVSVALGPYLALVAVSLVAPALDRWFAPRTLV